MHLTKWTIALAVASLATLPCGGGQPRYYRVSINRAPLENLPASCYAGGVVPTNTDKSTNVVDLQQWSVWDGTDGKLFLVVGDLSSFTLGNAERVRINGEAIEGGPTSFTEVREVVNPQRTTKTTATVSFTELSGTAKGTLTLNSETTCTNCGTPTCGVSLPFAGRKLEVNPLMVYTPTP